MAVPAASPTATPVIKRPTSSPGRAFHAASKPAAAIIVATAPSITPRRPARAAMKRDRQQRGDRPGGEDRVDHGHRERREVIPYPVEAVERTRQRGGRHHDQKSERHGPEARPVSPRHRGRRSRYRGWTLIPVTRPSFRRRHEVDAGHVRALVGGEEQRDVRHSSGCRTGPGGPSRISRQTFVLQLPASLLSMKPGEIELTRIPCSLPSSELARHPDDRRLVRRVGQRRESLKLSEPFSEAMFTTTPWLAFSAARRRG